MLPRRVTPWQGPCQCLLGQCRRDPSGFPPQFRVRAHIIQCAHGKSPRRLAGLLNPFGIGAASARARRPTPLGLRPGGGAAGRSAGPLWRGARGAGTSRRAPGCLAPPFNPVTAVTAVTTRMDSGGSPLRASGADPVTSGDNRHNTGASPRARVVAGSGRAPCGQGLAGLKPLG